MQPALWLSMFTMLFHGISSVKMITGNIDSPECNESDADAAIVERVGGNASLTRLSTTKPQLEPAVRHHHSHPAFDQLATCIDPKRIDPTAWRKVLNTYFEVTSTRPSEIVSAVLRPMRAFPVKSLNDWAPKHRALVLVSDRQTRVDCFSTKADESEPDDGCGLFEGSFSLLRPLRKCIEKQLEASTNWQTFRGGKLYNESKDLDIEHHMDTACRADEIIKNLINLSDANVKNADMLRRSLNVSNSKVPLEDHIQQSIVGTCFKAFQEDGADELKRALPCIGLMWNVVEVASPGTMLTDGSTTYNRQLHPHVTTELALKNTPSVCGRIAVALIMNSVWKNPDGYNMFSCWSTGQRAAFNLKGLTFESCLTMTTYNCICVQRCMVAAIKEACKLADECCNDVEMIDPFLAGSYY
eukprot:TRINITY_DN18355_c0_g1_i2.p1 TRINITY_DN18355_c0_g1~~TRINITY_DN18355_c0_g1_i2.p1  ORF type:complete len:433 (+),score=48.49 TRINITY_DN18355_c0_g1_i2:62-1300(+)